MGCMNQVRSLISYTIKFYCDEKYIFLSSIPGECWSGPSPAADSEYNKHGEGAKCHGPGYRDCHENDVDCVGAESHNFIYEIGKFFKYSKQKSRLRCCPVLSSIALSYIVMVDDAVVVFLLPHLCLFHYIYYSHILYSKFCFPSNLN